MDGAGRVRGEGPSNAKVVIVGEAPGEYEVAALRPFIGPSGKLLDSLLAETGFHRSQCYVTNVCEYRPPGNDIEAWIDFRKTQPPGFEPFHGAWCDPRVIAGVNQLLTDLNAIKPDLVIGLGNTPLWALMNKRGVTAWRGSQLHLADGAKFVPTYHPASILRQWEWRATAAQDLRRAMQWWQGGRQPKEYRFLTRPSYGTVVGVLDALYAKRATYPFLSVDIETRRGQIACVGLGWTPEDAISIPFLCLERKEGYWSPHEETEIVAGLNKLLRSPDTRVLGHNFAYDLQYLARQFGVWLKPYFDTMVAQHVCFAGLQKSLAYCASVYCHQYVYWKDDGKNWDPRHTPEDQLWTYNCEDVARTFECAEVLSSLVDRFSLKSQFQFQMTIQDIVNKMMLRGVKVDEKLRNQLGRDLLEANIKTQGELDYILGEEINVRSLPQMKNLFYNRLGFKPVLHKKTRQPTLDDKTLAEYSDQEPLVRCITNRISAIRSIGVFNSTFIQARLDLDKRLRTSFNVCGTETYRFSSSENPYGIGINMQNVPGIEHELDLGIRLPNVRRMFTPDQGYIIFEIDLQSADAQVVAAESGDWALIAAYTSGRDMHLSNANDIFGLNIPPEKLQENHPEYPALKSKHKVNRQYAKVGVHATNYGASPRTVAKALGISVAAATDFQQRWFKAHPGIQRWQRKVEETLQRERCVKNIFGFRRHYFDRVDQLLPQALAWIPQSTVAITVNHIMQAMAGEQGLQAKGLEILLQVHDSVVGQIPIVAWISDTVHRLHLCSQVTLPYSQPLTIGAGLAASTISWGDCGPIDWSTGAAK